MTSRVDLIPSPFDRLDPLARAIRWWTTQMSQTFGAPARKRLPAERVNQDKRLPSRITILLSETDAFVARLTLPKGSAEAHRQAIDLRLKDLAPTDPGTLALATTATEQAPDGATTYAIVMARRDRLHALETTARRKGAKRVDFAAEQLTAVDLKSDQAQRRERRDLIFDGALVAAVLAAGVATVLSWTARLEEETQQLTDQERSLRRAAVAAETARREAQVAQDFISRGVLDRRAGVALEALADLNSATPNGAWWTSIRWSPTEITLSAQSNDAARAIEAISASAKSWTVELSGSVGGPAGSSTQAFELKLRPRATPP